MFLSFSEFRIISEAIKKSQKGEFKTRDEMTNFITESGFVETEPGELSAAIIEVAKAGKGATK